MVISIKTFYKQSHFLILAVIVALLVSMLRVAPANAAVQSLVFPVIGKSSYSNDFEASRANGAHHATDIIADKQQKIVSASDGVIKYVTSWEGAGYSIRILGTDGFVYNYYHINNDTPGTDDGKGGEMNAFAADVEGGNRVVKGQLIGYVGDSGNAEDTVSHVHFEIYDIRNGGSVGNPANGGTAINPYSYLNKAKRISKPLNYPALAGEILPYGTGEFRGGSRIASGDVDGDGVDEIVTGAGEGGRYVKIFEKDGTYIGRFQPNGSSFYGGIDVATGDVDSDGVDEIITGAGTGGRYVKVFEKDGTYISRFQPNGSSFYGGVDVASGDVDGDGVDEIVTAAGKGGRYVKVFEKDGTYIARFMPINNTFDGGISVAVGDVMGDNAVEIIAAARQSGGPKVTINSVDGTQLATFYNYKKSFKGGVRVETAELDNRYAKQEILTIGETGGSSKIRLRSGSGQMISDRSPAAESWWVGYYDIAVVDNQPFTALNINRRTSLR